MSTSPGGVPASRATAQAFFATQVPRRLAQAPALFDLGRSIAFDVAGAGGWTLHLGTPARCVPGLDAAADCRLSMDEAALQTALRAPHRLRELFAQGAVRVDGALAVAMHLPDLLTVLSAPQLPRGLDTLFPSLGARGFVDGWPDRLHVEHGPLARLDDIAELSALASVHALLTRWPGRLRLADRHGGRDVDTVEAGALYRAGHHLAFSDAEQVFPVLRGWLARLRWELQLPVSCFGRCPIYCSPPGVGEALHFDQNANFVLQLRGEKRWWVAPNRHVALPTQRYTSAQPQVAPELRLYAPAQLPTELPEGAQLVHMKPGSVLYLPRGHWHQTEASSDSLSLNFTFDQPTWADTVPTAWRDTLLPDPAWRVLATGAGVLHAGAAQAAQAHLARLLAGAPPALAALDAGALLAGLRPTQAAEHLLDTPRLQPA